MPASVDRAGAPLPAPSPSSPGGGGGGGGGGEGAGAGGEEGEGALDAREWWGAAGPAARRDRMARASREDGRARAARTRRRAGADRRRPTSASRRQVGTSPRGAPTRPSGGKPRAATAPGPPSPREAAARRAARRGEAWRVGWGGPAGPAWPARAQAARLRGKGARARHRARQRRAAAATPQASQGGVRARTVAEARAVAAAPRHFAAARARMWPGRQGCCGGGGGGGGGGPARAPPCPLPTTSGRPPRTAAAGAPGHWWAWWRRPPAHQGRPHDGTMEMGRWRTRLFVPGRPRRAGRPASAPARAHSSTLPPPRAPYASAALGTPRASLQATGASCPVLAGGRGIWRRQQQARRAQDDACPPAERARTTGLFPAGRAGHGPRATGHERPGLCWRPSVRSCWVVGREEAGWAPEPKQREY